MKKESQKIVKKIVNEYYQCSKCIDRNDCKFWKGTNAAFDCGECTADEFAEGVYETLSYLMSMQWNEAINVIADSVKEEEE